MEHTSVLENSSDQYVLGSLTGIKQVCTTGKPHLLGLCFVQGKKQADELQKTFTQLCIDEGKHIWICGGKIEITLHAIGKDVTVDHTVIASHNNAIYTNTKMVTKTGIHFHSPSLASRENLENICATIQDCCGIVSHICEGNNALV